MRWIVFNILGFQVAWWACVLGAGGNTGWAGPLAVAIFGAVHLRFTPSAARDLRLLAVAVLLGLAVDGALGASGLVAYAQAGDWPGLAPAWIVALWAGFALTLTHSLGYFATRPLAAAVFGLFGGPLAYAGAHGVAGAVAFPAGAVAALAAVALAWAMALPVLYAFDRRFGGASRKAYA